MNQNLMAHKKNRPTRPAKSKNVSKKNNPQKGTFFIFGKHPVMAALKNQSREKIRLLATAQGKSRVIDSFGEDLCIPIEIVDSDRIKVLVETDSPHQGLALEVRNLPGLHLESIATIVTEGKNIILALDQVTDPHNIGAIMRSAAAFNVKAVLTTDRNSPPETGVLAKIASGALDIIPWIRVVNLSSALEELADKGFWRVGLDGCAEKSISEIDAGNNIVLILGSEGKGMREGTQKKCDFLVKLPISDKVESLNVSNAAAVALYELGK